MQNFFSKLKIIWTDKNLRNRILIMIALLIVFRLLAAIPVPGIDTARLAAFLNNNQFFGILNIFSGGGLSNLSIIMLGVSPYITASIIMQLLTIMVPRLKALNQEEGQAGKKKFSQYSRLITVPLALLQGFSLLMLLQKQGILGVVSPVEFVTALAVVLAGSMFVMWIGEVMTEYGISNGVSMIIFAGIIAALPSSLSQLAFTFDVSQIPQLILFGVLGLALIAGVVLVTEAERPIPVTYARQTRGGTQTGGVSTYVPLRVNQAGVIPIIFALSIMLVPQLLGSMFALSANSTMLSVGRALTNFSQTTWLYGIVYFVLVFIFTYFYTAVTFDPHQMSENLQKGGAFIPGIRPGLSTEQYISKVVSRITLVGALFLGIIAVLPLIVKAITGITAIALGGTAMLIVVSVVLDLIKKVDAQISMHEY
ncbi:MAG: preprotein translocase subunit SecY [Candidatus Pacebacteria bacterium]|nr:preprotein translocase subunit SecY [Candidatus Paceibacterota bacterium]